MQSPQQQPLKGKTSFQEFWRVCQICTFMNQVLTPSILLGTGLTPQDLYSEIEAPPGQETLHYIVISM